MALGEFRELVKFAISECLCPLFAMSRFKLGGPYIGVATVFDEEVQKVKTCFVTPRRTIKAFNNSGNHWNLAL
jgi:hypothetical protein